MSPQLTCKRKQTCRASPSPAPRSRLPSDGIQPSPQHGGPHVAAGGRHACYSCPGISANIVGFHGGEMCCAIEPPNHVNMVVQQSHSGPWREIRQHSYTAAQRRQHRAGARSYKAELGQFLPLQRTFSYAYISHKRAVITQCLLVVWSPTQYTKTCHSTKCC